jgi:hypothetical protein
MAIVIRWLSLPLAAFVAIAPIWLLTSEYQRAAKKIPTVATILDARVVNAARIMTEWEIYARYPVRGANTENSVHVWASSDLHAGDTVTLLVDPTTGDAEYDTRGMSWLMAVSGMIVATFFVLVGFGKMGAMLKRDRESRRNGLA